MNADATKWTYAPYRVMNPHTDGKTWGLIAIVGSDEDRSDLMNSDTQQRLKEHGELLASAPDLLRERNHLMEVNRRLVEACDAARNHLKPVLVEPGRTVFWKCVEALNFEKGQS